MPDDVFDISDDDDRVYDLFDKHTGQAWAEGEERESRIVLIGTGLDLELMRESFCAYCL